MHDEQIANYIKEIAQSNLHTYSRVAIVTDVDKDALTCTVKTADEKSVYTNVRLKEVGEKAEEGFWLIPKINSRVIINLVGYNQPYISMFSDIEEIKWAIEELNTFTFSANDGMQVLLDSGKFTLKNSDESLKVVLSDLIQAITNLQVPTGVGPSGFPLNSNEFISIKDRLSKLFKD
jgi:methylase of polypeptide subunit release factors